MIAHSGCGWASLFAVAPWLGLSGVMGCVGWNERWKVEPSAQWESNQERSFLWIWPDPRGGGGLSISGLKWTGSVEKRGGGCSSNFPRVTLAQQSAHLAPIVCFTHKLELPRTASMEQNKADNLEAFVPLLTKGVECCFLFYMVSVLCCFLKAFLWNAGDLGAELSLTPVWAFHGSIRASLEASFKWPSRKI